MLNSLPCLNLRLGQAEELYKNITFRKLLNTLQFTLFFPFWEQNLSLPGYLEIVLSTEEIMRC